MVAQFHEYLQSTEENRYDLPENHKPVNKRRFKLPRKLMILISILLPRLITHLDRPVG